MKKRALTDPVTGETNEVRLRMELEKLRPRLETGYTVVSMELYDFAGLCKSFGGEAGEKTLTHLSAVLRSTLAKDEPMGRVNGEVFYFAIKNRAADEVRARLVRVSELANAFNRERQDPYLLHLRFGAYVCKEPGESLVSMFTKTNQARSAVEEGVICHIFDEKVDKVSSLSAKISMKDRLDQALENHEFLVYYQPAIRLTDARVAGVEALVRWKHPDRGMLGPEAFLGLMDEFRMTRRLNRYVFEDICRTGKRWESQGLERCIFTVNLSGSDLDTPSIAEDYDQICRHYNMSSSQICFEMDESLLQSRMKTARNAIDELRGRGFKCILDKFGDKIISASLLQELEIDGIKLAPSFFSVENDNRRSRYVLEAVLKLAAQLHVVTVAQGVENLNQVKYLQKSACEYVQGYYFFQPMPPEELEKKIFRDNLLVSVELGDRTSRVMAEQGGESSGSSNIVMFSISPEDDKVTFSVPFSPVLKGQRTFADAASLFKGSGLIHENDLDDFFKLLDRCRKEDGWVGNTVRAYTSHGRYEWVDVYVHQERTLGHVDNGTISGTIVNVAGWKNEVTRWKEKANRDALTGLYNREYFEYFSRCQIEGENGAPGGIVFIDVDDFKRVNDTLGHMFGDSILCSVSKRILGVFRSTDVVARYGGDEFVVFVSAITPEILEQRLQQLCEVFRYPHRSGDIEYQASCSVGAAVYPTDGTDFRTLLAHADCALYQSKEFGKDRYTMYDPSLEGCSPREV